MAGVVPYAKMGHRAPDHGPRDDADDAVRSR